MNPRTIFFLVVLLAASSALAVAQPKNVAVLAGAAEMNLNGGSMGEVPFKHHLHQQVLGDCQLCHDSFPREKGAIDRLKGSGGLQKKQVMNSQCIQCHRDKETAGMNAGPTQCMACHRGS